MSNSQPLVSIIIPIYKAQNTLQLCVDSIVTQAYTHLELILVDDGSPDSSGELCDRYASSDSRIKVIHKENGGVSSARNIGLQHATGQYITFVDADDFLMPDYFAPVTQSDADIILQGWTCFGDLEGHTEHIDNRCYTNPEELKAFISAQLPTMFMRTPWGKFYKRNLLENIQFNPALRIGEDTVFLLQALSRIQSLCVCRTSSYKYYYRQTDNRYHMTPSETARHYAALYKAYKSLNVNVTLVLRQQFEYFMSLCNLQEHTHEMHNWYNHHAVKQTYKLIAPTMNLKNRLKYKWNSLRAAWAGRPTT